MNESISLGNVLTIVSIIGGLGIHLVIMSNKIAKHMAISDEKFISFEKAINAIITTCSSCYLKKKYDEMDALITHIKSEQDKRIAESPLQLDAIWKELRRLNESIDRMIEEK